MGSSKNYDRRKLIAKLKSMKVCSECGLNNDCDNNYCIFCGHKLKNMSERNKSYRIYCTECGEQLNKDDLYCGECGHKVAKKIKREKVCSVCGEWCGDGKYCWNCGHDNKKNINILNILCSKKCPNCDSEYDSTFNYCDECGTKLVQKRNILDELKKGYYSVENR